MEWTSFFSFFYAKYTSKNFDDNKVAILSVKPGKSNELFNTKKFYPSVKKLSADFFFAKFQITAKFLDTF